MIRADLAQSPLSEIQDDVAQIFPIEQRATVGGVHAETRAVLVPLDIVPQAFPECAGNHAVKICGVLVNGDLPTDTAIALQNIA